MTLVGGIAVFIMSVQIPFGYAQLENITTTSNLSSGTNGNWTTYTNDVFGMSFDYPSGWEVKEKKNRFDSGSDVSVFNGTTKFFVIILDGSKDNPLRSSDIRENTQILADTAVKNENTILIEGPDVTKYRIAGERAGSFVTKVDNGISPHGIQTFVVIHSGDAYVLNFLDSTQTFDSPLTQSLMNRILQSFKFVE